MLYMHLRVFDFLSTFIELPAKHEFYRDTSEFDSE